MRRGRLRSDFHALVRDAPVRSESAVDLEEAPSAAREDGMNRIERRAAAGAVGLVLGLWAWCPSHAWGDQLQLTPDAQGSGHRIVIKDGPPRAAGRSWGFWGTVEGDRSGSYRATCVWLANDHWGPGDAVDNRMTCTLVLSFRAQQPAGPGIRNGGSLVAQGLINRPPGTSPLFLQASQRRLAITGGTGPFESGRGYIDLRTPQMLDVIYSLP
jgi:hypothetical protein